VTEPKTNRYTVQGVSFFVSMCGDGLPLLMLPSVTMTHASWSMLRPHLEKHARLIMPDPIGGGRSDKPDKQEKYSTEAQAELMLGLLDALGLREAHVIGAAFGGATALAMAGKAPGRIRSALIVEGIFAEQHLPLWAARMRDTLTDILTGRMAFSSMKRRAVAEGLARATMREAWLTLSAEQRKALTGAYFDPEADRKGWIAQLRGADRDVSPLLADLPTPILYLTGELSTAAPYLARGLEVLRKLPRARIVIVKNGAHDLHIQQPAKVAELVLEFWREIGVR